MGILRILCSISSWTFCLLASLRRLLDPSVKSGLSRLAGFLRKELCFGDGLTDGEVSRAFGVLKTNCVGHEEHARALYPVLALINHSCAPNLDPLVQAAGKFGFKERASSSSNT